MGGVAASEGSGLSQISISLLVLASAGPEVEGNHQSRKQSDGSSACHLCQGSGARVQGPGAKGQGPGARVTHLLLSIFNSLSLIFQDRMDGKVCLWGFTVDTQTRAEGTVRLFTIRKSRLIEYGR